MTATVAACGGGAEVSLQLRPAADQDGEPFDTSALQSLTVTIANEQRSDVRHIVLDRERQVELQPLAVDKTLPFTIDVWCCENPDACEVNDVVMRGCTSEPRDYSNVSGTQSEPIFIFPVEDERGQACPQAL